MKRRNLQQVLLTLIIALVALSWVGSANGFPGMMGHWPGFQASDKGFPGWGQDGQDQDAGEVLELRATTIPQQADNPGYPGGPRGEGGRGGHHPPNPGQ